MWLEYPKSYYTMNRPDSLFFFIDLGSYSNRNMDSWAYDAFVGRGRAIDIFRSSAPLAQGYASFAKSRYYDALIRFREAARRDPDNALVYFAKAQAQIAVKDYRAAFEDIQRGMELYPEWADIYLNLTEIYSKREDLTEHTKQLQEWVERFPRDYKAHFVLGYFYYFQQDYDAAKNELLYALSWDEDLEAAHLLMDRILTFEAESEITTMELEGSPEDEPIVTRE